MLIPKITKQLVEMIALMKGVSCYNYIQYLFEEKELDDSQLYYIFLNFIEGYYSDEILDAACFTARVENIKDFDEFSKLLDEVYASFTDYSSLAK